MGPTVALNVELHANQELINASTARFIVIKSGKRFGKSYLAAYKIIKWAFEEKGLYLYIAPNQKQARNIAWNVIKEILPEALIKRALENELEIHLINGSLIRLAGAENEDALRGIGMRGVVFDEAAYIDNYIWNNIVRGQLLSTTGATGKALFISSPNRHGRNWYSQFYEDTIRRKKLNDPDWDAFFFTVYDNPYLSKEEVDKIKEDSTEDEWQTEYMANESSHAGVIYSEFEFDKHVTGQGPSSISLFVRGVDWGISHPTVCLFAQVDVPGKRVHIENEYGRSGFTIEESVNVIKQITGTRPVDWTVCDPSLNKRNSQTKRTDKQEFDRLGVFCIAGDNNDRGYNVTKMFFKKGIITIDPKCRNLIKELKTLQWGDDTSDDFCDALRYLCVRLHDTVFNGVFKAQDGPLVSPFQSRPYSLKDPLLFPNRAKEGESSLRQEIAQY